MNKYNIKSNPKSDTKSNVKSNIIFNTNFTVTEISQNIKDILNSEFKNKTIVIVGEISNLKYSGRHTYLTLKDENSSINVAFWNDLIKENENGDNVEITGKIDFYTKTSNINLIGKGIKNIGIGVLHTKYEQIRE